MGDFIDFAIIG